MTQSVPLPKPRTRVQAQVNVFAPWVLWPLARFEARDYEESPQAPLVKHVETFAVTPLMLSIVLTRETWRRKDTVT